MLFAWKQTNFGRAMLWMGGGGTATAAADFQNVKGGGIGKLFGIEIGGIGDDRIVGPVMRENAKRERGRGAATAPGGENHCTGSSTAIAK